MGQYYRPLLFKADAKNCNNDTLLASFNSWDYDNGLKLMEHSWVRNSLVCAVLCKIKQYGKVRIVWAGDYADDELQRLCVKIKESEGTDHPLTVADFADTIANIKAWRVKYEEERRNEGYNDTEADITPEAIGKAIDDEIQEALAMPLDELKDSSSDKGVCLYSLCRESADVKKVRFPRTNPRFIINYTKNQYVDIKHVECENPDNWGSKGWFIHPLPLLTCEGCGRGGGDYHQTEDHPSYQYIGAWARDIIGVGYEKADVEGFEEIRPNFHEN